MTLIEMSISGAVMIAAIALIRAFTVDKLPKKAFVILWELALLRLLVPFDISSALSIYNLFDFRKNEEPIQAADCSYTEEIPVSYTETENEIIAEYIPDLYYESSAFSAPVYNSDVPADISEDIPEDEENSLSVWKIIHIAGTVIAAVGFLTAYIICYGRFRFSRTAKNDFIKAWLNEQRIKRRIKVCVSDKISSPLTYGILNPVILLPENIDMSDTENLKYILAHELTHIKRFDMLRKIIAAAAVCLHWFDPAVWALYVLYNRDIELVCDEAVVRNAEGDCRSAYARALIGMEEKRGGVLYSSFSRNSIEERITAIMKTKKLTTVSVIAAFAIAAGVTAVFATSADSKKVTDDISVNSESSGEHTEESIDDKISALYNDGYENMTISQFRQKALEIMSQSEYERYFADMTDRNSADSKKNEFLFSALKPLTSEKWEGTVFDDVIRAAQYSYIRILYNCVLNVSDSDKLTVGDYIGVHEAINKYFADDIAVLMEERTEWEKEPTTEFFNYKGKNGAEIKKYYGELGLDISLTAAYMYPTKKVPDSESFPVNSKGMTYAPASVRYETVMLPDLVKIRCKNDEVGYMRTIDYIGVTEEAFEHYNEPITDEKTREYYRRQYKELRKDYQSLEFYSINYDIPVYDLELENVIDCFTMKKEAFIDEEKSRPEEISTYNISVNPESSSEHTEESIDDKISALYNDDYKSMTISNFRRKAFEIMSESEYERYFADMTDGNSADSKKNEFLFSALKPFTGGKWKRSVLNNIVRSADDNYIDVGYVCVISIEDAEKPTVEDYMSIQDTLNDYFEKTLVTVIKDWYENGDYGTVGVFYDAYNKEEMDRLKKYYNAHGINLSLNAMYNFPNKKIPDYVEPYPVNSKGLTYVDEFNKELDEYYPFTDLIKAKGINGQSGYMLRTDYIYLTTDIYEHYREPVTDETMREHYRSAYKERRKDYQSLEFYTDCYNVPLYDLELENVIDYFQIKNSTFIDEERSRHEEFSSADIKIISKE